MLVVLKSLAVLIVAFVGMMADGAGANMLAGTYHLWVMAIPGLFLFFPGLVVMQWSRGKRHQVMRESRYPRRTG